MRFKPKQGSYIALELDIPGGWCGETVLTLEEAKGLREQLSRSIAYQEDHYDA